MRRLAPRRRGFSLARPWLYLPAMPILPMPSAAADREREGARWNPDRETLNLPRPAPIRCTAKLGETDSAAVDFGGYIAVFRRF